MATFQRLSLTGWQRTGVINVACLLVFGIILLVILIVSIARPGASLNRATVIYHRHSAIRKDIDKAHSRLQYLDIGVPSIQNLKVLSAGKRVAWVVLLLISVPIHLLFNSSVFETIFQGSDWHLTIATESFTQGNPFYPPGASLSPSGFSRPSLARDYGYGQVIALPEYWNSTSSIYQRLSRTAKSASLWDRLSAQDCRAQYTTCKPRQEYGDVVVVVESNNNSKSGWTRRQIFDFRPGDLTSFWDPHVPPNERNPLWFSAQCSVTSREEDEGCYSTCARAFGVNKTRIPDDYTAPASSEWQLAFQHSESQLPLEYGYHSEFDKFTVSYCLAEPLPGNCKVVLSNYLLLGIVVCVFLKVVTCAVILRKLRHNSLVTPGDVIESFIMIPDQKTAGLCTLDVFDCRRLEYQSPKVWPEEGDPALTTTTIPRTWCRRKKRLAHILPPVLWLRTYCYLFFMMILVTFVAVTAFQSNGQRFPGSFGKSEKNHLFIHGNWDYFNSLLFVNLPQLFVSISYYFYNAFFTQLQVEHEWNEYSLKCKPLRVSYPKGQQISSYRLQLPYKYSIPLMLGSALCHWLLSNIVFLFIEEGGFQGTGFFIQPHSSPDSVRLFGVTGHSLIATGYSPIATLFLFITTFVLAPLPFLFSLYKVKGEMMAGGSNSLVISAACHSYISPHRRSYQPSPSLSEGGTNNEPNNMRRTEEDASTMMSDEVDDLEGRRRKLAQSQLRWGTIPTPRHVEHMANGEDMQGVLHLGFGDEDTVDGGPEEGQRYV